MQMLHTKAHPRHCVTTSLMQVHKHCTEVGLTEDEQEVRRQALYIIENLNLVNLAMRLCDFKDIHMAVEAKQVSLAGGLAYITSH